MGNVSLNTENFNAGSVDNTNRIINPNFVINQRKTTEYAAAGYTVDCWCIQPEAGLKVTPNNDGITLTTTSNNVTCFFTQKFENHLGGNRYTLSIFTESLSDNASFVVGIHKTSKSDNSVDKGHQWTEIKTGLKFHVFEIGSDEEIDQVCIGWNSTSPVGSSVKINWIKLESGCIATSYVDPDPSTELVRCQRYFRTISRGTIGDIIDTQGITIRLPFYSPMRISPTISILNPSPIFTWPHGWLDPPSNMTIISVNHTEYGVCYIHLGGFTITTTGNDNTQVYLATDNVFGLSAEL